MKKLISFAKQYGVAALSFAVPVLASADATGLPAAPTPSTQIPTNNITATTISSTVCNAVGWVFFAFIVLSIVMVLVAAFKYLTAGGDPEKVKSASHTLLYAAVAVLVALLAKSLPGIVNSFTGLTATGFTAC